VSLGAAVAFLVEVAKMLKPLVLPAAGALALLAVALGCGSADRPATSDSSVIERTSVGTVMGTSAEPTEPGKASRVCEPRDYRECRITYIDEDGQLQCPTDLEICSLEGTWLECGKYVFDENHDPQPRR
jgi:hypothetical protein